ncbi:uncharacterized protein LOC101862502 [Aplysia californica]|uniref:Uncharacterized protein LOC101862502 n=1 Tax=Aplysia californica TaxID=6500 RepID=A0ABM1VTB9_APLCA|nr:uncharacterized protein LOC101862502 [Aplysia californica]
MRVIRSERKDFVQSMQIPSPASSAQAGAGMLDSNPFGEEDETLGFLNSVHVLPKSDSSGGYDVYRTPTEPRRSSSGHNVLTYSGASHLRDQRASRTSETPKTPNSWTPSTHAIGPRPEFSNASHSGRRFSKNIGNPALRKKTHEKLVEATRTSELYRSTSALSDAPPLPSLPPSGNISNSRAVGPSKTIESTTFDPPSFGSSTPKPSRYQTFGDYNDLNSGYYPGTHNASSLSTPPKPKSVVYSGTDVESFHESLVIPSHKDSRNAGNNFSPNSYLARNRTPGGRESPVLYTQSQQVDMTDGPETGAIGASVTPNQKPGILALLKRYGTRDKQNSPRKLDENNAKPLARSQSTKELKVLPKLSSHRDGCPAQQHQQHQQQHQHYLNTQRCHERRSGGHHRHGSGQFGRDLAELECSCKFFHTHRFDGDAHNNDIEAIKERRQEIILASMKAEEEHTLDKVDDPRIIFWLPTLSFHPYTHGDSKVKFSSLWPRERELREHLQVRAGSCAHAHAHARTCTRTSMFILFMALVYHEGHALMRRTVMNWQTDTQRRAYASQFLSHYLAM